MDLTHDDVAAILDLIERSNVEYMELEVGGTRIVVDRSGSTVAARGAAPAPPPTPAAGSAMPTPDAASASLPTPAPAPVTAPTASAAVIPPAADGLVGDDLLTVTAPMVGVFYRSPEPGAPPFVEVGSRIEAGATMGLVEVMKMLNSITAPAAGDVVEVLAENEEFVEFGQPLFRLQPK